MPPTPPAAAWYTVGPLKLMAMLSVMTTTTMVMIRISRC
jgi:hypothetical protein